MAFREDLEKLSIPKVSITKRGWEDEGLEPGLGGEDEVDPGAGSPSKRPCTPERIGPTLTVADTTRTFEHRSGAQNSSNAAFGGVFENWPNSLEVDSYPSWTQFLLNNSAEPPSQMVDTPLGDGLAFPPTSYSITQDNLGPISPGGTPGLILWPPSQSSQIHDHNAEWPAPYPFTPEQYYGSIDTRGYDYNAERPASHPFTPGQSHGSIETQMVQQESTSIVSTSAPQDASPVQPHATRTQPIWIRDHTDLTTTKLEDGDAPVLERIRSSSDQSPRKTTEDWGLNAQSPRDSQAAQLPSPPDIIKLPYDTCFGSVSFSNYVFKIYLPGG